MSESANDVGAVREQPSTERKAHPAIHEQLEKDVWMLSIAIRIINALCIFTFFQPDEYFQALEPAWQIAFGNNSGAWITWEWQNQLRSSLHPALFALAYFVFGKTMTFLSFFPQFQSIIFVVLPRFLQGLFAAAGDYYTWKLAEKIYGHGSDIAWTAFLMSLLSPWQWFCSTRTLSNSLETVLTIIALYHWPWTISGDAVARIPKSDAQGHASVSYDIFRNATELKNLRLCLLLAGIASILRPTNLLIWISLLLTGFVRIGLSNSTVARTGDLLVIIREIILCGSAVIILSGFSDRLYYGTWTFPAYHWLNFNITQSLAVFYGKNDWHYYLSQGLPLLLTTYLPFGLVGLWSSTSIPSGNETSISANVRLQLSIVSIVTIATLSCIAHKEVRFIYPLLPGLHIVAAPHLHSFFRTTSHTINRQTKMSSNKRTWRPYLLILGVMTNLGIGFYTSVVHQRGVMDVLGFLRHDYEARHFSQSTLESPEGWYDPLPKTTKDLDEDPNAIFAGFLMPCHSTPWRSHLIHPGLNAWALTCEPPIHIPANSSERSAYRDEADRFYDDPVGFLNREVNTKEKPWPRYIIGFQGIESSLKQYYTNVMPGWIVQEKWRGFNSHWHDDERRTGDVVVWEFVDGSKNG